MGSILKPTDSKQLTFWQVLKRTGVFRLADFGCLRQSSLEAMRMPETASGSGQFWSPSQFMGILCIVLGFCWETITIQKSGFCHLGMIPQLGLEVQSLLAWLAARHSTGPSGWFLISFGHRTHGIWPRRNDLHRHPGASRLIEGLVQGCLS